MFQVEVEVLLLSFMYKIKQTKPISTIKVLLISLAILLVGGIAAFFAIKVKESKLTIDNRFEECYDGCSEEVLNFHELALALEERKEREKAIALAEAEEVKIVEERREEKRLAHVEKLRQIELARIEEEKRVKAEQQRIANEKAEKAEKERLAELEKKRVARTEEKKKEVVVSRGSGYTTNYELTNYTAFCNGCTGVTASGYNVSNTIYYHGLRVVAAPRSIPFYTKLRIHYQNGSTLDTIVLDRGGDIGTGRLDLLVSSREEAYRLGRQQVKVEVIP